ncbi:hypothetical protein JKP88DRAFT_288985 [Tribonema minus]|uniref:Uncharacterized protein n=1 Tax=Tribonema minus TaxID=303371 RepID=A0A836CGM5_9STRA|nr:hypothetical protein JKP88DRAFT_288985 [Tribonema minus]
MAVLLVLLNIMAAYWAGLIDELFRLYFSLHLSPYFGTKVTVGAIRTSIWLTTDVEMTDVAIADFPELGDWGRNRAAATDDLASSLIHIRSVKMRFSLFSLLPWRGPVRFESCSMQGATMHLHQSGGTLNFAFLALGLVPSTLDDMSCSRDDPPSRHSSRDSIELDEPSPQALLPAVAAAAAAPPPTATPPLLLRTDSKRSHLNSRFAGALRALSFARAAANSGSMSAAVAATANAVTNVQAAADAMAASSGGGGGGGSSAAAAAGGGEGAAAAQGARSVTPQRRNGSGSGSFGALRELGEAFSKTFQGYLDQVGEAFRRVGRIKLIGRPRGVGPPKRRRKYIIGSIRIDDACVAVGPSVWRQLLGEHVGAAFAPDLRAVVRLRTHELVRADGTGGGGRGGGGGVAPDLRAVVRLRAHELVRADGTVRLRAHELVRADGTGLYVREIGRMVQDRVVHQLCKGILNELGSTRMLATMVMGTLAVDARVRAAAGSTSNSPPPPDAAAAAAAAAAAGASAAPSAYGSPALSAMATPLGSDLDAHYFAHGEQWRRNTGEGLPEDGAADAAAAAAEEGDEQWRQRRRSRWGRLRGAAAAVRWVSRLSSGDGDAERPPAGGAGALRGGGLGGGGSRGTSPLPTPSSLRRPRPSSWSASEGMRGFAQQQRAVSYNGAAAGGSGSGSAFAGGNPVAIGMVDTVSVVLEVVKRTALLAILRQGAAAAAAAARCGDGGGGGEYAAPECLCSEEDRRVLRAVEEGRDAEVMDALIAQVHRVSPAATYAGLAAIDLAALLHELHVVHRVGPAATYAGLAAIDLAALLRALQRDPRLALLLAHRPAGFDLRRLEAQCRGVTVGALLERAAAGTQQWLRERAGALRCEAERIQNDLLGGTGGGAGAGDARCAMGRALQRELERELRSPSATEAAAAGAGGADDGGRGFATLFQVVSAVKADRPARGVVGEEAWLQAQRNAEREELRARMVALLRRGVAQLDAYQREELRARMVTLLRRGRKELHASATASLSEMRIRVLNLNVLAAVEALLRCVLGNLGKLPVARAHVARGGFAFDFSNVDLRGLSAPPAVDVAMRGVRLPRRYAHVTTPLGRGRIASYMIRTRCFLVLLDWRLRDGRHARGYFQPRDVTVLSGREGVVDSDDEGGGGLRQDSHYEWDGEFPRDVTVLSGREGVVDLDDDGGGLRQTPPTSGKDSHYEWEAAPSAGGDAAPGPDADRFERTTRSPARREPSAEPSRTPAAAAAAATPAPTAPLLAVRLSRMRAEMRDVQWHVRQAAFPHLHTRGFAAAYVSGMSVYVELGPETGGEGEGEGEGGGGGEGGAGGARRGWTNMRVTSVKVSVSEVKVVIRGSRLSGLYNAVADAFDGTVRGYIAAHVEAAVRVNVGRLLTLVNTRIGGYWGVVERVFADNALFRDWGDARAAELAATDATWPGGLLKWRRQSGGGGGDGAAAPRVSVGCHNGGFGSAAGRRTSVRSSGSSSVGGGGGAEVGGFGGGGSVLAGDSGSSAALPADSLSPPLPLPPPPPGKRSTLLAKVRSKFSSMDLSAAAAAAGDSDGSSGREPGAPRRAHKLRRLRGRQARARSATAMGEERVHSDDGGDSAVAITSPPPPPPPPLAEADGGGGGGDAARRRRSTSVRLLLRRKSTAAKTPPRRTSQPLAQLW